MNSSRYRMFRRFNSVLILVIIISAELWAQGGGGRGGGRFSFADVLLMPRVWAWVFFCGVGLALLINGGVKKRLRLAALAVILLVFGILPDFIPFLSPLGLHPSPMCITTKPLLFLRAYGMIPPVFIGLLAVVAVLSLIGTKLFCGWACPMGAVQEMMQHIPLKKKLRRIFPFRISNTVRAGLFLLFPVLLYTSGINIYGYLNPFEFFHWGFGLYLTLLFAAVLGVSLFLFRPFCHFICPLGLLTWLLEPLAVFKLKTSRESCSDCGKCLRKPNCPAVSAVVERRKIRPDCFACGKCMEECGDGCLKFVNSTKTYGQ